MDLKNKKYIKGANPYMPLWEHVPDGEPRVFTYNGETRVYVYGSHDTLRTEYCGLDQVVWSAPVSDLTDWRYDGVCFHSMDGEPLYAPDVVQKGDTFYMYAAPDRGSKVVVAKSKNPAGPFEDPVETELGFDPGILVDDDGRVYAYWGFTSAYCAELNDDMATIKPGTLREHIIPHCERGGGWWEAEEEHADKVFSFFEASSLRKIGGKYIYIYSRRQCEAVPEEGLPADSNGYLAYAYSDEPLGGWVYGGIISNNAGELIECADGTKKRAYPTGNNHGSIIEVNGQWYVFYHRMTGTDEFARQAMLDPIDVAVDGSGRVYIGRIEYNEAGEPVSSAETEMTSQGAHIGGLDSRALISAGYACCLTSETEGTTPFAESSAGAYIKPVYEGAESSPIVRIKSGTTAGFRYIDLGTESPKEIYMKLDDAVSGGRVSVRLDSADGECIAAVTTEQGKSGYTAALECEVTGKHALYFRFEHDDKTVDICGFDFFTFE